MARLAAFDWQIYDGSGQRKYLNKDEVLRFLREADRLPEARRALCYFLANTGCRISEALALTRARVDAAKGVVTLLTLKRRKTTHRDVPVPDDLVRMLLALPVGKDGQLWPMHRTSAWRFITEVMERIGIHGVRATIRGLRHAYGMRCAEQGVIPSLIQRWMGHATLRMTMVYLDATGEEERRFASRVWWPQGGHPAAPARTAMPAGPELPPITINSTYYEEALRLRQENAALRRENTQLRTMYDRFAGMFHQFGDALAVVQQARPC